jgi:hypothetical protein
VFFQVGTPIAVVTETKDEIKKCQQLSPEDASNTSNHMFCWQVNAKPFYSLYFTDLGFFPRRRTSRRGRLSSQIRSGSDFILFKKEFWPYFQKMLDMQNNSDTVGPQPELPVRLQK